MYDVVCVGACVTFKNNTALYDTNLFSDINQPVGTVPQYDQVREVGT